MKKMRYRIEIITYANGRKDYLPQKKVLFGWSGIGYDGDVSVHYTRPCDTREQALERIDKNFKGNTSIQSIEFEYIYKIGGKES